MSCGAQAGGAALDPATGAGDQAVIAGVVRRDGSPEAGAYVRLLDSSGEFAAEVPTDGDGNFRFFATSGTWTVRAIAPGGVAGSGQAVARQGAVASLDLEVA